MNDNQSSMLRKIKDAYKPKLFLPICTTLIALGPYGHLWFKVMDKTYDRLFSSIILASIALISIGAVWGFYFAALSRYYDEKSDYLCGLRPNILSSPRTKRADDTQKGIHTLNDEQRTMLREIKDAYKPKLFLPIYTTLVALGPYGHLWLDLIDKKYDRLFSLIILANIALISIGAIWGVYFAALSRYYDEKSDYLRDPDNYDE